MKDFFRKHSALLIVIMVLMALASNLVTGFLQERYASNLTEFYAIEAVCKYVIAALVFVLMLRWRYVKRAKLKNVLFGFLLGLPFALFVIENLLPITLVQSGQMKVYWSVVISIVLAKTAVGMMEELGVRGVLLPLLCEKWKGKQRCYMKSAVASSLLFGCMHFSWSIREILTSGSVTLPHFLENLNQVFFTFCFGMLAAGITLYVGSVLPVMIWHSLTSISAFLDRGLMHSTTYSYYYKNNLLTMQNVFEKYGILPGIEHGYLLCSMVVNILVLFVGIVLVQKVERKCMDMSN